MPQNNNDNAYTQIMITYAKILGWIPVVVATLFSIIFILVYDHIENYVPSYCNWLFTIGVISTIVKIMINIFISLGGWRLFKTTIKLKHIGVIDRNPITSIIYECCDALMILVYIIPISLIVFATWILDLNLILLNILGYIIKLIFVPITLLIGLLATIQSLLGIKKRNKAIKVFYRSINSGIDRIAAIELANMVDEKYPYLESLEDYIEKSFNDYDS